MLKIILIRYNKVTDPEYERVYCLTETVHVDTNSELFTDWKLILSVKTGFSLQQIDCRYWRMF